ncbi:MAG: resolvase [Rhodospirillales bacterium]|nr:resolvase [Rhodospirillales bacterium]
MKRGYIRLSKAGPSLEEQQAALRSAGIEDFTDEGPVYVDQPAKRKQRAGDVVFPQREECIKRARPGDVVIVASPGRLATSADDALRMLAALGRKGAQLQIVSTGRTYHWDEAALDGLELAADTAMENRAEVTAKARAAATERRPAPKLSGKLLARAKELWADPKLTAAQVEADVGVPIRTLYRRLGGRGTPSFGKRS